MMSNAQETTQIARSQMEHVCPSKRTEYVTAYNRKLKDKARRSGTFCGRPWRESRANAKQRGIPFDLPERALPIPERCPVLGIPLDCRDRDHTPSVDRVDNRIGYVLGNCAIISFRANRMKTSLGLWEIERLAEYMRPKVPAHYTFEWTVGPGAFAALAAVFAAVGTGASVSQVARAR